MLGESFCGSRGLFVETASVGVLPDISADTEILSALIDHGASFFPVKIGLQNGKCIKKPTVTGWQKQPDFHIKKSEQLVDHCYGYHPETIGAYVVDMDDKGGVNGEETLIKEIGDDDEAALYIRNPRAYCDSPNGRHLYFRRDDLEPVLLFSRNGIADGVDIRGDFSGGWLVAPGSVGWSARRQEWVNYIFEGDLDNLPSMPRALRNFLAARITAINSKDIPATPAPAPPSIDFMPSFIAPARPEEMLPEQELDPGISTLFSLVSGLIRSPAIFEQLVQKWAPAATRDGPHLVTGDYAGNAGGSCRWTASTGIVKDFASPEKGGDLLWWVERQRGLLPIAAARYILSELGFPDPSAPDPAETPERITEAATTLANAASAPETGAFPLTDSGNAERLVCAMAGTMRYNTTSGCWMVWDGKIWVRDTSAAGVFQLATKVSRSIAAEALVTVDNVLRKQMTSWAQKSESNERLNAMIKLAAHNQAALVSEEDFDLALDHFNCDSGIIDLKTGTLLPHDKSFLFTQITPFGMATHTPSRFLLFFSEIFEHDPSVIEWMHQYLGYSLTGRTDEQIFPIWWGGGQNGKSVLLSVFGKIMGDFCKKTATESWLTKLGSGGIRDDIAALRGARFAWSSEPDAGRVLATAMIKELTGGDPITCRHLYGRLFTYIPKFKTAFVTNHKPKVHSQDFGIWRRLRFVPFMFRVPESQKNPRLAEMLLEEEGPAILGWLVEGAKSWYATGRLPDCQSVLQATQDLKSSDDALSDFFGEFCVRNEALAIKFDDLWAAYREWNDSQGVRVYWGRKTFKDELSERSGLGMRKYHNCWTVTGIALKNTPGSKSYYERKED